MDDTLMTPLRGIYLLWIVWYATWLLSAGWRAPASAKPLALVHIPYQAATLAALAFLFASPSTGVPHLWTLDPRLGWALVGAAGLAFLFCWWARIEMGRLWSGYISRTAEHRVVDSGPFALVRHPIYTGIIAAAFATAAIKATEQALIGAGLFVAAFWMKARIEESFLRSELGAEAYDSYRRRVPMLFPLGRRSA